MSASNILDTCRASLSGCQLTAFGDLKSELILCVSAARPRPREDFDALCRATVGYFDAYASIPKPFQEAVEVEAGFVVSFSARESIVCTRAETDCDEFVLAVLNGAECLDAAVAALDTTARALASDG